MSDLTHLFSVGEKVRCKVDDSFYNGIVKETYMNHIIVDVPEISDHMWYENGVNIGDVYPENNFEKGLDR